MLLQKAKQLTPPPMVLVLGAIASTQLGSAIAKSLFAELGPLGMVTLRVGFAAVVLMLLWRPRIWGYRAREYGLLLLFGISLAAMNSFFYAAIARIPIGVGVALEFVGPLTVALLHSRRRRDFLWVGLAAVGIILLAPIRGSVLDPVGVLLALLAGGCWGSYILLSAQTGKAFKGGDGLALAMLAGAILLLPLGVTAEGVAFWNPWVLLVGFGVAMLSSAVPYSFELAALRHIPLNVFGVLMSLEPAIAAALGFVVLGEVLTPRMIVAIALVMIAAIGVSWTNHQGDA